MANIMERSLHLISQAGWLYGLAKEKVKPGDKKTIEMFDGLITIAEADANFATAEYECGSPNVYAHHSVALWGALESTAEQIAINHMLVVPDASAIVASAVPTLSGKMAGGSAEDARQVYRRWEFKTNVKDPVGKRIEILSAFGHSAIISDDETRDLNELAELRHVLVHRNGVVDGQFIEKCGWTSWKVGDKVHLGEVETRRYFDAAGKFATALINGAIASPYRTITASL